MDKYKFCHQETTKHQEEVSKLILEIIYELKLRASNHDDSKRKSPELDIFAEYTPKLKEVTYGSEEYNKYLQEMKVALEHHYKMNRHHPEHFKNGIRGMNLIDIIEMFCDWKAATLRHNDGDIMKSIELNKDRFNMSDDLVEILKNTAKLFA